VPLRILFADDSMTAQNMGKKILTDAGYEVIAVSNGAAAVKKIAEQKPDIIILDVYMPGYSGLEVCEKVRASIETLKTPVLLTVGKMEPYKPEDASRVRADGVIIKPFEASDLLAIVKKLEERIAPKAVSMSEQTILLDRPPDFSQFVQERDTFQVDPPHPEESTPTQPVTSVPHEMASSAAFGDMLGMDLYEEPAPVAAVMAPPPLRPAVMQIDAPMSGEFDANPAAVMPPIEIEEPTPVTVHTLEVPASALEETPVEENSAPIPVEEAQFESLSAPISAPMPEEGPSEADLVTVEPELLVHGVAPEVGQMEVAPDPAFEAPISAASISVPYATEPALEPTAQFAGEVTYVASDPALLSDSMALKSFSTKFGVDNPEEVPVGIAADVPELQAMEVMPAVDPMLELPATEVLPAVEPAPEPPSAEVSSEIEPAPEVHVTAVEPAPEPLAVVETSAVAVPPVAEDDFEARVARAMSVYEQSMEAEMAAELAAGPEPAPVEMKPVDPMPFTAEPLGIESMDAPERSYATTIHAVPVQPAQVLVAMPPPAPEPLAVAALPVAEIKHSAPAQMEGEMSAAQDSDDLMIAAVVQRVMDRIKPGLIEEIVRELRNKK